MPAAASRWARATRSSSAPTTPSMSAAASPSAATSASRRSTARRACSIAAACCRCSAAGARPPQVGFYGIGTPNTSVDDRANYSFRQPYLSAALEVRPDAPQRCSWAAASSTRSGSSARAQGSAPSVEEVYTPDTLPGLGAKPDLPAAARDGRLRLASGRRLRAARRLLRRHVRSYADQDGPYSFRQVDYEAIQHIPILSDAWVLSLRGRVQTTYTEGRRGGAVLHAAGARQRLDAARLLAAGASAIATACCCRPNGGCSSTASSTPRIFYDAGKVEARRGDLNLDGLKSNYGIGFRLHGPFVTPVRIELARSNEGIAIVFGASAAF